MATTALNLRETLNVVGAIQDTVSGAQQPVQYGQSPLLNVSTVWVFGTGANLGAPSSVNANIWFLQSRPLASTSFDNLTLYGSLADYEGVTINMTHVKRVMLTIASPTASTPLYLGPQNQTHAAPLWFSTTTTTYYDIVYWDFRQTNPFTGWAVGTNVTNVLPIQNPNTTAATYTIWILGDE